jgi:hypothetical protein
MLLAIDPGMRSPGAALFVLEPIQSVAEYRLAAATKIEIPAELAELDDGKRWLEVATRIHSWASKYLGGGQRVDTLVYEKPQFYQRKDGGSKGDPNKLAGVLAVACSLAGRLSCHTPNLKVCTYTPAEWIGQISKLCAYCERKRETSTRKNPWHPKDCPECHGSAWETPRGRRIRSRLHPIELALVPDQNDAIDAVGLGLKQALRLTPQRTYSNS